MPDDPGSGCRTGAPFFRVGYFDDFHCGDPAIVVGADRAGMQLFQTAVRTARAHGSATFTRHGVEHTVSRYDGAAGIELARHRVRWRVDDCRLVEILALVRALVDSDRAGHQYLDTLTEPDVTVILSVGEYVDDAMFDEAAVPPWPPGQDDAPGSAAAGLNGIN